MSVSKDVMMKKLEKKVDTLSPDLTNKQLKELDGRIDDLFSEYQKVVTSDNISNGDVYYYWTDGGTVGEATFDDRFKMHNYRKEIGNIFATEGDVTH